MNIKTYVTAGIAEASENNAEFRNFINNCLHRHFSKDWGEVAPEDAEFNNRDPQFAMSSYTAPDGRKIWLKQDFNILTVLFPSEY